MAVKEGWSGLKYERGQGLEYARQTLQQWLARLRVRVDVDLVQWGIVACVERIITNGEAQYVTSYSTISMIICGDRADHSDDPEAYLAAGPAHTRPNQSWLKSHLRSIWGWECLDSSWYEHGTALGLNEEALAGTNLDRKHPQRCEPRTVSV